MLPRDNRAFVRSLDYVAVYLLLAIVLKLIAKPFCDSLIYKNNFMRIFRNLYFQSQILQHFVNTLGAQSPCWIFCDYFQQIVGRSIRGRLYFGIRSNFYGNHILRHEQSILSYKAIRRLELPKVAVDCQSVPWKFPSFQEGCF